MTKHNQQSDANGATTQFGGMEARGVSRPMAEQQTSGHQNGDESTNGAHHHEMTEDQRLDMLRAHHKHTLWVYWSILMLGFWMVLAPITFGYLNPALWSVPSLGERGVWFSSEPHSLLRAQLMTWSDIVSGVLLLVFGWRSLTPNRPISLWICCGVGVWLTTAPVVFWAPTAAGYLNDTVVGTLLIALTILIPGMPNMIMYMQMGGDTPPGWTYNPSSWPQRWIMIVTGFAGWVVSRYIAAFQLGYIDYIWDPFFGFQSNTEQVLNSQLSHAWPISDGALGAFSYTFEFLMGWMGSTSRWRTMPWMVTFFGILVISLGLTHILLVISQPVVVGAWCSMCLLAALIMLPMIPLEVDEVVAMGQHMVEAKRRGDRNGSWWQIFWKGGTAEGCTQDERSPELLDLPQKPWQVFKASIWGMTFPWTLTVSTVLGLWLMFSPTVFGLPTSVDTLDAADINHLGGALVITISVICMGEVIRVGRYLNIVLASLLIVGTWLLSGSTPAASWNVTIVSVVLIGLTIPRGTKAESYGLWDRMVR